jgi:hypothetical protein
MGQRLAVIGLVLAAIAAIFLFTQQQQALKDVQNAQTAQAEMEDRRATDVVQVRAAGTTGAQAEQDRSTAVAFAQNAGTAQAEADSGRETAAADARIAGTQSAELVALATAQVGTVEAVRATAEGEANLRATVEAESTAEISTAQAQIDAQATKQTDFDSAIGTATAQVDLAEFARQSAEDDRATALVQFWVMATANGAQSETQTPQATISGATAVPTLQPTSPSAATVEATPAPTTAAGVIPPLTESFTTNDKKLTFKYPQGWVTGETSQGPIVVASSRAILQRSSNELQSGEVEIQMIIGPTSAIPGVSAGATPSDVMRGVRDLYKAPAVTDEGDTTEIKLGQHAAARFDGKEGNNTVVVTVVDLGSDTVAIAFAYSFPGEMDNFIQVVDDILTSLEYQG